MMYRRRNQSMGIQWAELDATHATPIVSKGPLQFKGLTRVGSRIIPP